MWNERARRAAAAGLVALLVAIGSPLAAQEPPDQDEPTEPALRQQGVLRLFGAVEWDVNDRPDSPNSFALGQLDLFLNAALSERITLLGEFVLEESTATEVVTDLERLQITFRFDDHLQVSAGRYHTGIGFYNTAFHHGAWFETAIGRPRVFLFEDDGGVLPVHDVGITTRGAIPGTRSSLYYLFEVGNGRSIGGVEDEPRDTNDAKAVNGGIAFRPDRWRGLELGASLRHDVTPQPAVPPVDERIGALYAVYRTPSTEVLAEWVSMAMRPRGGPQSEDGGGYVQVSHAWGMVRPYYRFDRLDVDATTPVIGHGEAFTGHLLGLRIDPTTSVGFKAQYERFDAPGHPHGDAFHTQLVFVF